MAEDAALSIQEVSKRYVIGHQARADTLRDRIAHGLRRAALGVRNGWRADSGPEEFWALRDVSFEVRRGEVVGLIGRNGAGKSTLLKILSRITEPTAGLVRLRGRVASLLEVGTGFHPELTGRENIFLNGAILGMSRAEIRRKFAEIVEFAEVERFLDTPVKHYSSGMYVRLAFAVAAHLEPEILVVDEVLAVGDIAFQKKCLGKMEAAARGEGRTILFVSHNLAAIRQLCRTTVLLSAGRIQAIGPSGRILDHYLHGLEEPGADRVPAPPAELLEIAYLVAIALEFPDGRPMPLQVQVGAPWRLRVRFRLVRPLDALVVSVGLVASDGAGVQTAWSEPRPAPSGDYDAVFEQTVTLASGSYTVVASLSQGERTLQQIRATRFEIGGPGIGGYFPTTFGVGAVLNSMRVRIEPK
ncbi:MAG: ABC transporter ATP-binding protein [Opitutaceae bacterium]